MPRQSKVEHNITRMRLALGLTRGKMAAWLGIPDTTLEAYEKPARADGRQLPQAVADAMESEFGVSAACLLANDLTAPLVTCQGDEWRPIGAGLRGGAAYQSAQAVLNAQLAGCALRAIYESAARQGRLGVMIPRVVSMLRELEQEFGFCSEVYEPMKTLLEKEDEKTAERLDKIASDQFRDSDEFKRLNEGGVFRAGDVGKTFYIPPDLLAKRPDDSSGKTSMPDSFWEKQGMTANDDGTVSMPDGYWEKRGVQKKAGGEKPTVPPKPRRKTNSRS